MRPEQVYLGSLFGLRDRVAIVTGAARGNGLGIVTSLARAGARVFLSDVLGEVLEERVQALREEGASAAAIAADLTAPGAPEEVVARVEREAGRIDILVNNAGITRGGAPLEYSMDDWAATFAVNLRAPFLLSRAAARVMARGGGGSIVNITSLNAEVAFRNNPAYVSSKGGLKMLGKSLALDLAAMGIRVNNVGLGYFRTDMTRRSWDDPELRAARAGRTMLGRWGDPETDLAGLVIFLASDASGYVTGQDFYLDGGWLARGE